MNKLLVIKKYITPVVITILSIVGYGYLAFAVAPSGGYSPAQTLDPACAPGDTDCFVVSGPWATVSGGINYAGGNVGIGTTTPGAKLEIYGQNTNNYIQQLFGDSSVNYNGYSMHLEDNSSDHFGSIDFYNTPEEGGTWVAGNGDFQSLYRLRTDYVQTEAYDFVSGYNGSFIVDPYAVTASNRVGTRFRIEDNGTGSIEKLGDVSSNGHNNMLIINDGNGFGTINIGRAETVANDGIEGIQIYQDGDNPLVKIGSTGLVGNGTLLTVDDLNNSFKMDNGYLRLHNGGDGVAFGENYLTASRAGIYSLNGDQIIADFDSANNIYRYANGAISLDVANDSTDITTGNLNIRNVSYSWPNVQAGGAGYVLTNDGSGVLSWAPGGGGTALQWYAENSAAPGIAPIASGAGSIALGSGAEALSSSMFVYGSLSGKSGSNADNSNFIGSSSGQSAVNAYRSNFFGPAAGKDASNASDSNFFGFSAGRGASSAWHSNFLGGDSGSGAISASHSNFLGWYSGKDATNANNSNFMGATAGQGASSAWHSNFFGAFAGQGAVSANNSNFLGQLAGTGASGASNSNFLGMGAGMSAANSSYSTFIGTSAGAYDGGTIGSKNANNAIFIGNNAGFFAADNSLDNSSGGTSILIGDNTSTGGFSNSIALGAYAANTSANQFIVGSTVQPIDNVAFLGSGSLLIPRGTSAQRTSLPEQGMVRFSTENDCIELYKSSSSSWGCLAASGPGGRVGVFSIENTTSLFSSALVDTGLNSLAVESFFAGTSAGKNATDANNSNFIGYFAGAEASSAENSNFFGAQAGRDASGALNSNFLGAGAGQAASSAASSNFFGYQAGKDSVRARNSNFIGEMAGSLAPDARTSNFFGDFAGYGAGNSASSNFFGSSAGRGATDAGLSNFLGSQAGRDALNANNSNFLGSEAGRDALNANNSNFFGTQAGKRSSNASASNFFGPLAGSDAVSATNSNFLGQSAGQNAIRASYSNFLGYNSGLTATDANNSNFFGYGAGLGAANASNSNFLGLNAGQYNSLTSIGTPNAANSIFIGTEAAHFAADNGLNNTTNSNDYSILLGNYTSTGGFKNSIAIGQRSVNTASNQLMIGSTTRAISTVRIQGSSIGTQCTITTGTGMACTSDERLKTNIVDISSDALTRLANVRTVHYNLIGDATGRNQVGFLAQNLEQYFPELVDTNADGYKSVYYAQMTPILVEAVKELDIKLSDIQKVADATDQTFVTSMRNWFANTTNGITLIISDTLKARNQICIDDVCMTKDQLRDILQKNAGPVVIPTVPQPVIDPVISDTSTPSTPDEPVIDDSGTVTDSVIVPETPVSEPAAEPVPDPVASPETPL